MRKIIEVENEGYEKLLGEQVLVFCMNYIYTGKLVEVNTDKLVLGNSYIVYDTGAFDSKSFNEAEKLGDKQFININSIESLGKTDKQA